MFFVFIEVYVVCQLHKRVYKYLLCHCLKHSPFFRFNRDIHTFMRSADFPRQIIAGHVIADLFLAMHMAQCRFDDCQNVLGNQGDAKAE